MKKFLTLVLTLVLILPAARFLFGPGYFNMHDDLQVMRIFEMEKCFADGQIPCRWAPDMAWGYGQAMFNFYSAFPYYLGVLIRMVTPLSIMGTVLLLFLISLIGAAAGMYLLAREFWGRTGGILAAILYTYAPYHALDIFIRGALAESFALAILPFVWLAIYKVIKNPTFGRVSALALALSALFTTHNVSSLIYAPFTAIWAAFWVISLKKWRAILDLGLSGLLGMGLSAFFLFPNLVEQGLIQKEFLTIDYSDFRAHFVTIRQLFLDRSWGHGPSIFGPKDEISFQIGWPHWWLIAPLGLIALVWYRKKKTKLLSLILVGLLGLSLSSAFLTHSRSTPIWLKIPIMAFIQFPWRFLGLTIFALSFAGGALAYQSKFKYKFKNFFVAVIILVIIVFNYKYFEPWNRSYKVTDEEKLSGVAFELQQKSAILDYLPKTAPIAPKEDAPDTPVVVAGEGKTLNYTKRSNSFFFDAEIYQDAQIQIPVMYFPGWVVISRGKTIPSKPTGDYGVITISLPEGKHVIQGRFQNTPVRSIGNAVTVLSLLTIFGGYLLKENKQPRVKSPRFSRQGSESLFTASLHPWIKRSLRHHRKIPRFSRSLNKKKFLWL